MSKKFLSFAALLATGVLGLSGCSQQARLERALSRADRYYSDGAYDQAEIEYKNVIQNDAQNAHAFLQLGRIYFDQGRVSFAYAFLSRASELAPNDADAQLKLGSIYFSSGQLEEAHAKAETVLALDPTSEDAPLLLANSIRQTDEIDAVRQRLLSLPGAASEGAPVLLALGTLEYRQGNLDGAEALYRQAEALAPESPSVYSAIAALSLARGNQPQGEEALKKAADLAPLRSSLRLQYVQYLIERGASEQARGLLEEMGRTTPDYLPATVMLAGLVASEQDFEESEALLESALARDATLPGALLLRTRIAIAQGQGDLAVARADEMLRLFPDSPAALEAKAAAYVATGQPNQAASSLNQALALAPNQTSLIVSLAQLRMQSGEYNGAIVLLRQLVQDQPQLQQGYLLLADAYNGQGNFPQALAVYVAMDQRFPPSPLTPFTRGRIAAQQGRLDEARREFAAALALSDGFLPALEQLTNLDVAANQFDAAQLRLEAAIGRNPNVGGLYLLLARIHGVKADFTAAEAALKRAIELQPDDPSAYYQLASIYYANNEHLMAIQNLEEIISRNPRDTQALMLAGILQEEAQDFAAARDSYEQLLTVEPRFGIALNNLAYIYAEQENRLDRGLEVAEQARAVLPQESHVADTLGWIYFRQGQYARALALLVESATKLPDEAEVQYHLGMAQYMMGNTAAAQTALQRALSINDQFPGADTARARLSLLTLDVGNASRTELEQTVAQNPNDPVALAKLADLYVRSGDASRAIAAYNSALQASPTNAQAAIGLMRLYASQNQMTQALELARNTRRQIPSDANVARAVGEIALQSGDHSWAQGLLQEASRTLTNDPTVFFNLAQASYAIGRVADAETAMRRALQVDAQFAESAKAQQFLAMTTLAANPQQAAINLGQIRAVLDGDPSNLSALMAQGAANEQASDTSAAKETYERALVLAPTFAPAKRRLAILYAGDSSNNQRALELGLQAREMFPSDPDLGLAMGTAAYRTGDYARAITWLQESLSARPANTVTQFYLGMARLRDAQRSSSQSGISSARQTIQTALNAGLPDDLAAEARRGLAEAP